MAENHGRGARRRATERGRSVAKATSSRRCVAASGDPRCARTRASILEAFAALSCERGTEAVSVSDICRKAGINKATFYRHYEDRADLLDRGLGRFFAEIGDRIDPATVEEGRTKESAVRRIEQLFEFVEDNAGLMKSILSGSAGSQLRRKAERFIEEYIRERRVVRLSRPDESFTVPRDAVPGVLASLCAGLMLWWLDRVDSVPVREIARCYLSFIASGLFEGRARGR